MDTSTRALDAMNSGQPLFSESASQCQTYALTAIVFLLPDTIPEDLFVFFFAVRIADSPSLNVNTRRQVQVLHIQRDSYMNRERSLHHRCAVFEAKCMKDEVEFNWCVLSQVRVCCTATYPSRWGCDELRSTSPFPAETNCICFCANAPTSWTICQRQPS